MQEYDGFEFLPEYEEEEQGKALENNTEFILEQEADQPENKDNKRKTAADRMFLNRIKVLHLPGLKDIKARIKITYYKKKNLRKKSKEKKKSNQTLSVHDLLTLPQAYEILNIDYFPVSYEEVRISYYSQELRLEGKEEKIQLLKRARKLIFENININPFEEEGMLIQEEPIEEEIPEEKLTEDNLSKLKAVKCRLRSRKKGNKESANWKDLSSEIFQGESEPELHNVKEKKKSKASQETQKSVSKNRNRRNSGNKNILLFLLPLLFVIYIAYINYKGDDGIAKKGEIIHNTTSVKENELEEEPAEVNEKIITIEKSLEFLVRDGLKLQNRAVSFSLQEITEYVSEQSPIIPWLNICLLKREFEVNKGYISYRVSDYSLYRFKGSNEPQKQWRIITNIGHVQILNYDLTDLWKGSAVTGSGKFYLENVVLDTTCSENGYLTATLTFLSDRDKPAILKMEGLYNQRKNEFNLEPIEWIERPTLFVAPSFWGTIDLSEKKIVQKPKTKSTTFTLIGEKENSTTNPSKEIISSLLRKQAAVYEGEPLDLTELELKSYNMTKKQGNMYDLSFSGILEKGIGIYEIKGSAELHQYNNLWVLGEIDAKASLKELILEGQYKGSLEWEKNTYALEAEIYKENGQLKAKFKIKEKYLPMITKSIESRRIIVKEDSIIFQRKDILKGNIIGNQVIEGKLFHTTAQISNITDFKITKRENY